MTTTIANRFAHLLATLLVGLSAGFFYAYESSVTRGLAEVDDRTYVQTFQALNETVRNPLFGVVFFGSLPALVLVNVMLSRQACAVQRRLLLVGLLLYVAGMVITVTGNVALNDELAEVGLVAADADLAWIATDARDDFEADWNRWNGWRTLAFVGSFAAVSAALAVQPTPH